MKKQKIIWGSSNIAEEAERMFPDEFKIIKNVKMLHAEQIGRFLYDMEKAHREAGDSKLIFK